MRSFSYFLTITAFLLLSGCIVNRYSAVITDYDHDADFLEYTTYYWSDEFQSKNNEENPLFYNSLTKKRLKKAIQSEMNGRGYQLDPDSPDLLVNSRVLVETKDESRTSYTYSPYYYGYFPYSYPTSTTSNQKKGGVIIELIDKSRKQLVWQGYVPEAVEMRSENKQEEIRNAVSLIFSEYTHRAD